MAQVSQRQRRIDLHLPVNVSGVDQKGATFACSTRTLNVSGGGIGFELPRPLSIGGRITLQIELPPALRPRFGGRPVYRAQAIVCRMERLPEREVYRVGARFLGELEA